MFDLIQPEYKTDGGATVYEHNNIADISIFKDMGSVRRVPIEAVTAQHYSDVELCEYQPMPDYSALQNTATGEVLKTRPVGSSYKLVLHDELFANHADVLGATDLPTSNVAVMDRIYDGGFVLIGLCTF